MRKVIVTEGSIQGEGHRKEIDYSSMPFSEILQKIRHYESKYSKTYKEFILEYDDDEAAPEESSDQFEWSILEEEKQERIFSGRAKIILNSNGPKSLSDLVKNDTLEKFYQDVLLPLEKEGVVEYRE